MSGFKSKICVKLFDILFRFRLFCHAGAHMVCAVRPHAYVRIRKFILIIFVRVKSSFI